MEEKDKALLQEENRVNKLRVDVENKKSRKTTHRTRKRSNRKSKGI